MDESRAREQLFEADPASRWRKLARCGAVLAIASTLIPIERDDNLWMAADDLARFARGERPGQGTQKMLVTAFCLMMAPVMLSGAAVLVGASRRSLKAYQRVLPLMAMFVLFLGTALLPAYFFGFHMKGVARDDAAAMIGIGVLICFLFVAGLLFLVFWDRRKTPLAIFPLGIMPLVLNALAWLALALVFLAVTPPNITSYFFILSGWGGSVMMLIGWLMWGRAVRREYKALAATPSVEAPPVLQ
jgi:hypothetical protein